MIYSMTAYAEYEKHSDWGTLRFELKSINHRYLELSFKLPDWLKDLEIQLRDIARREIRRGKIDCSLTLELNDALESTALNIPLIVRIIQQCQEIQRLLPTSAVISPLDILKWPKVVKAPEQNAAEVKEAILVGFHSAVVELMKKRAEEGNALSSLIKDRLQRMSILLEIVRKRIPEVLSDYRERLLQRLKSVVIDFDVPRLEQELVYAIAKLDVEEELDRLATHVQATEKILVEGDSVGRRLDFLMQEMNREANTLASKSIDSEITDASIELKVLIEQVREQIQNLV